MVWGWFEELHRKSLVRVATSHRWKFSAKSIAVGAGFLGRIRAAGSSASGLMDGRNLDAKGLVCPRDLKFCKRRVLQKTHLDGLT